MRVLPKTISEKEFLDTIKKIPPNKKYIRLAFMLGFYECMRISEVINLRPEHIDKNRGFIHILAGKGNKDRDIPIMKPVASGLRYLPIKIGVRALQKQFKKYFPLYHFHTLRHSGATYYLNDKGLNLRQVQQLLGHSRIDTTQIYTHITPNKMREVFESLW
jgi:site-specific recombinase XerD